MAFWHSLAKLRMHTDATLDLLDETTTALGESLRQFSTQTCAEFSTKELKREAAARNRREQSDGYVNLCFRQIYFLHNHY
jgi:chorismate-pyruvate lyase